MRAIKWGLVLLLPLISCVNQTSRPDNTIITVSILPQKFFVEALAPASFKTNVMVPPGTGHATYDPSPQKIRELEESSIFLAMGHLGFENAWLPRINKNHPDLPFATMSEGIEMITNEASDHVHEGDIDHHHEGIDPHTWLSPKSARIIASNTAAALKRVDPSCSDQIQYQLDSLLTVIDDLDDLFTERMAKQKQKKFIIFHPALTYLARDYGLEQLSMEIDGKEPSASHLKQLVDLAKKEDIKTIFVQKEYDQENAETLARELKAKIAILDPLSADWHAEMLKILDVISSQ